MTLAAPDGYSIVPTDSYEIEALILSRARSHWDREADLSPVNMLLGWGSAAIDPILNEVNWSQSGRWGWWQWDGDVPIDERTVARNVANVHIIPDFTNPGMRNEVLRPRGAATP